MGLNSWFGFGGASSGGSDELPDLFPLSVTQENFIAIDVFNIYSKILTDVVERTEGLTEDDEAVLWDNCLASESNDGLITLLSRAMTEKNELFLVYDKGTKVLRKATNDEMTKIKADYKSKAESSVGTYITFKNYTRTDMVKLYSALEYCTVGALNKSMNLSKAIQFKVSDLRTSVGLIDKEEAKAQGKAIAHGLARGKDILADAKDIIETAKPDLTATQSSMELLNQKRSFYLGLPCSYITGELNSGLGDSGQADAKAIERGLKNYFFAIIKPVCKSIFGKDLTFESDDFQQLDSSLNAMKTFELTSEELMTTDNKRKIVNRLFGFPEDEKGGQKELAPLPPSEPDKTQLFHDGQGNVFKQKGSKVEKA